MLNHKLNINTILHTKDGSKIGNAIVTGCDGHYWEITTDYGNKVRLTTEEIYKFFNIAYSNCSKEIDGYSCQEMQEMMSSRHKHRVVQSPPPKKVYKNYAKFNLNYNVRVRIKDKGIEHYVRKYNEIMPVHLHSSFKEFKQQADADGYHTMQMHSFMDDFGCMGLGLADLVDTNIYLFWKDVEPVECVQ